MAANHLCPCSCDMSIPLPSAGTPAPAAVGALTRRLGLHKRALNDHVESVDLAEGVGQEGVRIDLTEDPAPGVDYAFRDGGAYAPGHRDIGEGVMGRFAEDQLTLSALGGLDADLGVDVYQQGRMVKANAAGIRQVLEVEGGELVPAGGTGAPLSFVAACKR